MKLICVCVTLSLATASVATVLAANDVPIIDANRASKSTVSENYFGGKDNTTEVITEKVALTETVPDDYLKWFFYHSFKKLDEFFQQETDKEMRSSSEESVMASNNWKVRVSKVILKLVLIILAIVGSILFVLGVFVFMFVAFLICKFVAHILQCFQERQKYKNNSTTYQVNV